jgi:hypothetical protein
MDKHDVENTDTTVDEVRRKLLKIGIYAVPTIALLGRVPKARASGYHGGNEDCSEDQNTQGNDDCQGDQDQQ